MASNGIGIWMDQSKAIIVKVRGDEASVERLEADVEAKHRATGGMRASRPYWHRSVNSARRADAIRADAIRRFYADLAKTVGDEPVFLLIGPGEGKEAFARFLADRGRAAPTTAAATSRLSEAQIVARIKTAAGRPAPRRSRATAGH